MRLKDLQWITALAEHRHMTDAAAVLGIPQSTLSRALSRVEDELGIQIFQRLASGLHPTPLGERVIQAATEVTERLNRLRNDLATDLHPETGVVRLAFLDSTGTALVPSLLRRLKHIAPKVRVELKQEPGHEILEDLQTGRADLALARAQPAGNYGWLLISREPLVLVVPPDHRLAGHEQVQLKDLGKEAFVTTPKGFGFRAQTDTLLASAGIKPEISFEAEDAGTIEGLVSAGLGVAIIPAVFAGATGSVAVQLRDGHAVREIGLIWRTDTKLSAPAQRLKDLVDKEFSFSSQRE